MRLVFGNYQFDVDGVAVTARTTPTFDDAQRPIRWTSVLTCRGYLTGAGQADLTTKENQLRAALLIPYQNFGLLQDSGAPSSQYLSSSGSISGVTIVDGPHFPEATGPEFVTTRTFEFTGQAEFAISGTSNRVLSWTESLQFVGTGGQMQIWRNAVNARPQRQVVYPYTVIRIVQSGQAVGHTSYPTIPGPIWPAYEVLPNRVFAPGSPRRLGQGLVEYPVQWRYEFESDVPLVGLPNVSPL